MMAPVGRVMRVLEALLMLVPEALAIQVPEAMEKIVLLFASDGRFTIVAFLVRVLLILTFFSPVSVQSTF